MKHILSIFIIIVSVVITGCNSTIDEAVSEELCSEMLYFDNVDEMYVELNKVQKMTDVERNNWEKSKGFKSLGLESERLYASIVPEDFKSVDEVKQFVESNSKYLKLVQDESGELELETSLDESPFKYLANKNSFFQIGDSICKVYSEGVVSSRFEYYHELNELSFKETIENSKYSCITNRMDQMLKSSPYGCLLSEPLRETLGDERIRLDFYPSCHSPYYELLMNFQVRGYNRFLGVWFNVKRDLACDLNIDCAYKTTSNVWDTFTFDYVNSVNSTKEISGYLGSGVYTKPWSYDPYDVIGIWAYCVDAEQDNVGIYSETCDSY